MLNTMIINGIPHVSQLRNFLVLKVSSEAGPKGEIQLYKKINKQCILIHLDFKQALNLKPCIKFSPYAH